jgi:outer membrane protein, heavy metal efflux system
MRYPRALLFVAACAAATPVFPVDWTDPQSVVAAALDNNPTILRLQTSVAAARERIGPAGAQPNPMAMAGVQNKQIDLSDDEMMTMYMLGAQQTFASGEKRRARRTVADLEARALEQQIVSARAEIERDALTAWYDAAAADSQITAAEQVGSLIDAIVDSARVRYEVGNATQSEVIRAQLEKSNLEHQILTLRGARNIAVARLLPLVGLPLSTSVPRLHLPHSTERREIDEVAGAPDHHPALTALNLEMERQESLIQLARLQKRPDIALEASYGYRRSQMDMFSVVASVEIPFRRNSVIEPQIRAAVADRDVTARRLDELRRELSAALGAAAAAHDQANEQLRLHEEVLVPQARLAFESTLSSYQTGKTMFDSILAAESTYLRLQLDYYQYLAEHIKAIVAYEAILKGAGAGTVGARTSPSVSAQTGSM